MSITQMGEGIMGTLFAPFVKDVLHGTGSEYGLIVGIQGVGGIIGGLAVTRPAIAGAPTRCSGGAP